VAGGTWVGQAQVIAIEMGVFSELSRQQAAAERAIGQGRERRLPAIGQQLVFDLALEQVIWRLQDVQLGEPAKSLDLRHRKIAHADRPNPDE
jgi:hypothetical protein